MKRLASLAFFWIATCLVPQWNLQAQQELTPADTRLVQALQDFIPHLLQQGGPAGLNIAVGRHGQLIWESGFGYADLEKRTPMTASTVFHSGSIGKTFTATAVMQLVEQGVMGLHDPINKYLKFKVVNPLGARDITVFDLLTHRSGLTTDAASSEFLKPEPLAEHVEHAYARRNFEMYGGNLIPIWSAKVGERFQYSNLAMATLGLLVEVTNPEKLTFSQYVQKHILDPMGMTSTQYPPIGDAEHVRPEIFARISKGYARFGAIYLPTPTIYFADYPAGNVWGTPGDLIRLALAYANGGTYHGYQLLKPETVKQMISVQATRGPNPDDALGLVWWLRQVGKPDFNFAHGGLHMFGWTNEYRVYPGLDVAVAIATNEWDMVGNTNFKVTIAMVEDFVLKWLQDEQTGKHAVAQAQHTWGWKTSYVVGLIMAERLKGGLGIRSEITPQMVDAMATGVKLGSKAAAEIWDSAGFRAGLADMSAVEMTPAGIRAFLDSNKLQVSAAELPALYRELGTNLPQLPWGGR